MTLSSVTIRALSTLAAGLVVASGFSGAAVAEAAEITVDAQPSAAAPTPIDMIIDFDPQRVTLGDGRPGMPAGEPEAHANSVVSINSPDGTGEFGASIRFLDGGKKGSGSTLYQIYALGQPTGYWVSTEVSSRGASAPRLQCAIVKAGAGDDFAVVDHAPYSCSVTRTREDRLGNTWLTTSVSLNRWVESSGTVTVPASSPVSLAHGVFHQDSAYSVAGAGSVAAGESARFLAVTLEGEAAKHAEFADQARSEFAYEILLDGQPTGYWVGGLSTNYRGWSKFSPDGHCGIYEGNPLPEGHATLDDATPSSSAPFRCSADGGFVNEGVSAGHIHYDATFTVEHTTD